MSRPTGEGGERRRATVSTVFFQVARATPGGAARPTGSQGASGGASTAPIQAGEKSPEEHRLTSDPAVEGGGGEGSSAPKPRGSPQMMRAPGPNSGLAADPQRAVTAARLFP
ncbi:hypothetical protein NDU88_002715 [Pleurodeles waltl]|uniref:Uncharacterized protein n=1 Tax=Pleurodeles waltl TaxID=8319 RepID=A0AAV7LGC3_PLEWA|nr:hypothetical protein NDU88_002715 [Pleurodeles waltl]